MHFCPANRVYLLSDFRRCLVKFAVPSILTKRKGPSYAPPSSISSQVEPKQEKGVRQERQAKECRKLQYAKSSGSNAMRLESSTTERRKANGKMFILSHRKSAIRLNKLLQCRSAIVAISKVERTTQTINVSSDRRSCLVFSPPDVEG